jgi:hypothetical protein
VRIDREKVEVRFARPGAVLVRGVRFAP